MLTVPSEYYCPLDQNGRRTDANERPELCQGSVELIAPAEYMVRPPMPPVYFFLIDVSESATKTGMLEVSGLFTYIKRFDQMPGTEYNSFDVDCNGYHKVLFR
jgi:protein transport protein SEC24